MHRFRLYPSIFFPLQSNVAVFVIGIFIFCSHSCAGKYECHRLSYKMPLAESTEAVVSVPNGPNSTSTYGKCERRKYAILRMRHKFMRVFLCEVCKMRVGERWNSPFFFFFAYRFVLYVFFALFWPNRIGYKEKGSQAAYAIVYCWWLLLLRYFWHQTPFYISEWTSNTLFCLEKSKYIENSRKKGEKNWQM